MMSEQIIMRLSGDVHALSIGQSGIKSLISSLPTMNNESLVLVAREATTTNEMTFLLRGGCAYHFRSGIEPLHGGRGKRDEEGNGLMSKMKEIADLVGVDPKTLHIEAKIYAKFFLGKPIGDEIEHLLPKEYYATALTAGDRAEEALELAYSKKALNPAYRVADMKSDVVEMNCGAASEELELKIWLNGIPITEEAQSAMYTLCKFRGITKGELLSFLLVQELAQCKK